MWSPTHVQIIVQRARNVIAKGKNGTNDAYVIIQNGKEKFQTSIKEQSIDPVWHEECDLLLESKETDIIKLIVLHRNLFGLADEFLGQALIPLKDFDIYERPKSRWYPLEGRSSKKSSNCRGEIEVRITFIVKSSSNEKTKKKTGIHQSLLDIRASLKNESNKAHIEKTDPKNTISRKLSMSAYNKVPKLATRSLSFKLESFNSRRKSLVDRFRRRQESAPHEQQDVKVQNDQIVEELNKSQGEYSVLDPSVQVNSDDIVKIKVKNEVRNEAKNQTNSEVETCVKPETNSSLQTKSSLCKTPGRSLRRALSSNNMLLTSGPIKPNRERSSTLASAQEISEKLPQFHARDLRLCKNEENIINNQQRENVLRQTLNKESVVKSKLKALKNSERRHTIDINEMVPNLTHSSIASEKRATQASPDSLYSSFESLINKKPSKTDYHQKYESLNKEELIQLIETQHLTIIGLNEQINDLEEYIDNLLVRVIENSPRILQNPYKIKSLLKI